jgi:hypothetical protein
MHVPVININSNLLMPTSPSRARRMIKSQKATPFWNKGVFCIRLNYKPKESNLQSIVIGVDPGSKKEGITIKSKKHTYANFQLDAVDWVKNVLKARREARRARRQRKTPYRKRRFNRGRKDNWPPPSTKARWQWKLRFIKSLISMYPITDISVEDIKARTKEGNKKWNKSFSPLEVGKKWFYSEIEKLAKLHLIQGYQTYELRNKLNLTKSKNKLDNSFEAHCVDSWVICYNILGGSEIIDNKELKLVKPLRFHRRQLQVFNPSKGNIRRKYGGTRSCGLTRGTLVKHNKYGLCYVGGEQSSPTKKEPNKMVISLHNYNSGKRVSQNVKIEDIKILTNIRYTIC